MVALSEAQLLEKWQWAMGILQQEGDIPDDLPPEVCAQVQGSPAPPSHLPACTIKGPSPTGTMMVDSPAGLMDFAVDVREAGSPTKVMEVALATGATKTSLLVDQEPSVMEQVGPPEPESENAAHMDVVEVPHSGEASIHAASSCDSQTKIDSGGILTEREEGTSQKGGGVNQPQTPPRNPMKHSQPEAHSPTSPTSPPSKYAVSGS